MTQLDRLPALKAAIEAAVDSATGKLRGYGNADSAPPPDPSKLTTFAETAEGDEEDEDEAS